MSIHIVRGDYVRTYWCLSSQYLNLKYRVIDMSVNCVLDINTHQQYISTLHTHQVSKPCMDLRPLNWIIHTCIYGKWLEHSTYYEAILIHILQVKEKAQSFSGGNVQTQRLHTYLTVILFHKHWRHINVKQTLWRSRYNIIMQMRS